VGAEHLSEADYCQFLLQELENRILQLGADNVAAFIAEPIMGAGGVLVAPEGYHLGVSKLCQRYDLLYIADEVVTGFGRLGEWFSAESIYGIVPDIIVTAKGITSGYIPLGAAIISSRIFDVISQPQCEGGVLSMGFTYTGHPVACAAALQNIEIMERENLLENVKILGPVFEASGRQLLDLPIVGDVRGSHFMMAIEMVTEKESKECFAVSVDISTRIFEHCRKAGVIVRPVGSQVILSPPLTLDKAGIATLFSALKLAIEKTTDDLIAEGLWCPPRMAEAV